MEPMGNSVISVGPNIVTVAVFDIFYVKKYDLDFWPLKVIRGSSLVSANPKPMAAFKKSSSVSNLASVTIFKIFGIEWLWPWPITFQGHPKWSSCLYNLRWVQHHDCCCSWHFTPKSITLIFDTSRSSNLTVPIESLWVLHRSVPVVQTCSCHRFLDISSRSILTWTLNPSGSSEVRFDGVKLAAGL